MRYAERVVFGRRFVDAPEMFTAASPVHHVHAGAPPFLVLHGSGDTVIPVEQARFFASRLRAASHNPVLYAELPGAQHGFDILGTARAAGVAATIETFLDHVHDARRADLKEGA